MNSINSVNRPSGTLGTLINARVARVLMICSNYDAFILEEDGKIESQVYSEYIELGMSDPPAFTWANSSAAAKALMDKGEKFDLIICMFNEQDTGIFPLAHQMKENGSTVPFVLLMHYSREIRRKVTSRQDSGVDYVFSWHGNADLIIAIIKLFEDRMNADYDILKVGVQAILLVEDSIRFYSTYLPELYKMVLAQSNEFLKDTIGERQQKNLKRSRPKILLANCYDEAVAIYEKYKSNFLGIITDIGMVIHKGDPPKSEKLDAGIDLVNLIRKDDPYMPILMQSSQGALASTADALGVGFVRKYSRTLFMQLSNYIKEEFGFGDFVFRDSEGKEYSRASSLQELEALIKVIPDDMLVANTSRNMFSKWFFARGLFSLGKRFRTEHHTTPSEAREFVLSEVKAYRIAAGRGVIAKFDSKTYDSYISFARLGDGSLGGKARGLAFLNRLVEKHKISSAYEGISISTPRTVVVGTDYFDEFIRDNGLHYIIDSELSDDEILSEFVASRLPERMVEELKTYLKTVSTPLAIRSSSKLEDSNYQPFAGVYSTYMIPYSNNSGQMLRMLDNAIKSVYASVFYAGSRTYIQTTGNLQSEEKMAVVIQAVRGSEHEGLYYPMISGVARSVNFYPIGNEKAEDGIVNVVFGLGKSVVDGGQTLRFSPRFPRKILQLSQPDLAVRDTQRMMYALDLHPGAFKISRNEGINLAYIPVQDAMKTYPHPHYVFSTFDISCERMVPGIEARGPKIVSYESILKYGRFALAQALKDILEMCRDEMQCEVEMEFAADLDAKGENMKLSLLQVRPITQYTNTANVNPDEVLAEMELPLVESRRALGNGYISGMEKIVLIDPGTFDSLKTREMSQELSEVNATFRSSDGGYLLIGPGRWGSSDPNLGIPVIWSDISEARMIVECAIPGFQVEPSQGTHFFQNITSLGVGYLSVNLATGDGKVDLDAIASLPCSYDGKWVKVYDCPKELKAFIDRNSNRSVVGVPKEEEEKDEDFFKAAKTQA
ncbi:MAG: phosphoenolpyruvate synthase [Bacteroidales bacterium]|nr:phosphoenolpyruvate synthase [Bacteroidales bacterium]